MKKINMKKTVSTILIAAMLASGAGSAFAFTPSATYDPKCIDIRHLNDLHLIQLPEKSGQKVCGCKTCEVSVMTYDMLTEYINLQLDRLEDTDFMIIGNIRNMIKEQTNQVITEDVILFTNSARAVLSPFLPKIGKIIGIALVGAETLAWIYFNYQSRKFEIKVMEGKNKIKNTKAILRYMKAGIESKNYLRGNVYLSSMNNQAGGMDALGRFEYHEGITPCAYCDEAYFDKVKEHIDVALKKIEKGDFSTHEKFKPDDAKLTEATEIRKVAIPTAIITEVLEIAIATKILDANKIAEFLRNKVKDLSFEDALEMGKTLLDDLLSGNWKNFFTKSGPAFVTFILGRRAIKDDEKKTKNTDSSGKAKEKSRNAKNSESQGEKIKLDVPNVSLPTSAPAA